MKPIVDARPSWPHFLLSVSVLFAALIPLSGRAKTIRESLCSREPNKAEREANAAGYYEGLISVQAGQGSRGELSIRLLGKPTEWVRTQAANVSRPLPGDFLSFELKPNLDETLFGHRFTTNSYGLRDREYELSKPPGTTRIVILGSSIDMGWGIGTEDTYANLLEDWLNLHSERFGLNRRYQVINFAVAAYAPGQRLEAFRRKAIQFDPDLVLYAATMLDPRLMEIHLGYLMENRIDIPYPRLLSAVEACGITDEDLRLDSEGELDDPKRIRSKVAAHFWDLQDAILGDLVSECRSRKIQLGFVIIPRAGKSDTPEERAIPVARYRAVATHHAVPIIDLSDTFDKLDPAQVGISAWDDHPNVLGHKRLFLGLARALSAQPEFARQLFNKQEIVDHETTDPAQTLSGSAQGRTP